MIDAASSNIPGNITSDDIGTDNDESGIAMPKNKPIVSIKASRPFSAPKQNINGRLSDSSTRLASQISSIKLIKSLDNAKSLSTGPLVTSGQQNLYATRANMASSTKQPENI